MSDWSQMVLPRRSMMIWLAAFFAPAIYFVLIFLGDKFHFGPSEPGTYAQIVGSLIYIFPLAALLICWCAVLLSKLTVFPKTGWILFTLFAMAFQIAALVAAVFMINGFKGVH